VLPTLTLINLDSRELQLYVMTLFLLFQGEARCN
jgi:hypothetical protein